VRGGLLLRAALGFVGALPWVSALGGRVLPAPLMRAIELAFAALCHHVPERTLVMHAQPMCVCSRCAGLYAGIALAALSSWSRGGARPLRLLLGTGLVLMLSDIVTQDLGLHAPWHAARLATGALVGGSAAAWMLSASRWV
jgi:uncharacterized membrane protein